MNIRYMLDVGRLRKSARDTQDAIEKARRVCIQRGEVIYAALSSDTLDVTESMQLSGRDFGCLCMFIRAEQRTAVLDAVWRIDPQSGEEAYYVRLGWDIAEIMDV